MKWFNLSELQEQAKIYENRNKNHCLEKFTVGAG